MRKFLMIVGVLILGTCIGLIIQPVISGDNVYQQEKKFDYILNTAIKNYVEDVDTQKLVEAAIKGMLGELDVHSIYIPAEEMKRVEEDFQGSFEGIGIEFDIINDTITVVSPIPGGPSEQLGIMSGDKIVKIDNENAVALSRADVPKKLRGPKGTIVNVDIKRSGDAEIHHFAITRNKIPILSVDGAYIIDGTDIGVVKVNRFSATTHDEMMEAMRNLRNQGMKKMILDLRYNPGGYLQQAYLMADEFLPKGDTVVFTKGRKPQFDEVYISGGGEEFSKIPLIVLVNEGSASASEIVSGAIQDLDRGLIVGETSYGKGLVQRQYDAGDGSAFRLTIAKYYTPSGRCIQRPYKDKDKYRALFGRMELEEGSYIDHAVEKIKQQVHEANKKAKKDEEKMNVDSLPIYKTKAGRFVFGGGGITPDYIVKSDTVTKLTIEIMKKNLFLEYANNYLNGKGKNLRTKYGSDFTEFLRKFDINSQMLQEFKALAESKGIKWDNQQYEQDKENIITDIKANIARNLWDRNRFLQVYFTSDKQMLKAIELFPEAIKLAKLK